MQNWEKQKFKGLVNKSLPSCSSLEERDHSHILVVSPASLSDKNHTVLSCSLRRVFLTVPSETWLSTFCFHSCPVYIRCDITQAWTSSENQVQVLPEQKHTLEQCVVGNSMIEDSGWWWPVAWHAEKDKEKRNTRKVGEMPSHCETVQKKYAKSFLSWAFSESCEFSCEWRNGYLLLDCPCAGKLWVAHTASRTFDSTIHVFAEEK